MVGERTQNCAQHCSGILCHRYCSGTCLDHLFGAVNETPQFQSHSCGGDDAKVRERVVAAANTGQSKEDVAETVFLRDLLHLRSGVGDGYKLTAYFVITCYLLRAIVEVLLEDVGLQRAA